MSNIGITFSGGGIKGIAHLGILQYLTEIGIKPTVMSGTSAGSLIAAFYAAEYSPKEIFEIGKKENFFSRSGLFLHGGGLFSPDVFSNIIKKYIPHDNIKKLKIPIYITATDITNAKLVTFKEGSIALAVKSSCAVPLIFHPVLHNGKLLSDGGLLNNLPVDLIKDKCDKIIGINVNSVFKMEGKASYQRMIERSIQIAINKNSEDKKNICHIYMEPLNRKNYKMFDFNKMDEIYDIGYAYAKSFDNELFALLNN
ncbi:patatin-like phospholipase family protein [Lutibacter aestuarii]|uniref:Patatin-like phospholipase family protein n=1 Tax=Lutibacter aestuarii TaxID=861111 RepID=A0ABW2Z8A7_9FLAO